VRILSTLGILAGGFNPWSTEMFNMDWHINETVKKLEKLAACSIDRVKLSVLVQALEKAASINKSSVGGCIGTARMTHVLHLRHKATSTKQGYESVRAHFEYGENEKLFVTVDVDQRYAVPDEKVDAAILQIELAGPKKRTPACDYVSLTTSSVATYETTVSPCLTRRTF